MDGEALTPLMLAAMHTTIERSIARAYHYYYSGAMGGCSGVYVWAMVPPCRGFGASKGRGGCRGAVEVTFLDHATISVIKGDNGTLRCWWQWQLGDHKQIASACSEQGLSSGNCAA